MEMWEDKNKRPNFSKEPLSVWLILEGGGAKGLVHIGAIKALNTNDLDRPVEILGTAGTSAGAMVAALLAAGYTGDDMLNDEGESVVLKNAGAKRAIDLFGANGWRQVRRFRFLFTTVWGPPTLLLWSLGPALAIWWVLGHAFAAITLALSLLSIWCLVGRPATEGLVNSRTFISYFNRALAVKLDPSAAPDRPIMFSDLPKPLRVVATNLNTRSLKLFSQQTTPDVPVAEAVAASVALPLIFQPPRIGGALYCDGGLVSNLPAWTFDEERTFSPGTTTIAVEIPDKDASDIENSLWGRWKATAKAAIFGAAALNKRMINGIEVFPIPSKASLLAFDMSGSDAAKEVNNAKDIAAIAFALNIIEIPQLYESACRDIHDVFQSVTTVHQGRIRVFVLHPTNEHHKSLHVRYGYNVDEHIAARLLVPLTKPIQDTLGHPPDLWHRATTNNSQLIDWNSPYLKALIHKDIQWVFSVPVEASGRTLVACIDSDIKLSEFSFGSLGDHAESLSPIEIMIRERLTEVMNAEYSRRHAGVAS